MAARTMAAVAILVVIAVAHAARPLDTVAIGKSKSEWKEVRDAIKKLVLTGDDATSYGPIFVRLAWHSSGSYSKYDHTGGSNGARMRYPPEANYGANAGLKIARDALEPIKTAHPWISYSDLYTYAGAIAIQAMGGPFIPWRPGRTDFADGSTSPPDGRLPDASKDANHVRDVFTRLGFGDRETVALIGAHTLGRCHTDRSGFDGPWTAKPITFTNDFFQELVDEHWVVRKWSGPKQYELANRTGDATHLMMLPTDMALTEDPRYKWHVQEFAKDQEAFFQAFALSYSKLLELGVPFSDDVTALRFDEEDAAEAAKASKAAPRAAAKGGKLLVAEELAARAGGEHDLL